MNTYGLKKLTPNPSNPRVLRDDQYKKLLASIKRDPEFLSKRPIVHAEGVILGGNMRYQALMEATKDPEFRAAIGTKKAGEVPEGWVLDASEFSEEQRRRFVIVDNAPDGMSGEWDWDVLANEWGDIDLGDLGMDVPEWEDENAPDPKDAGARINRAEELNETWQVKAGDLWQIGEHRLLCGDSTKPEDVARLMGGEMADEMITDPPYGVSYVGGTKDKLKLQNDNINEGALRELVCNAFNNAQEICRGGAYWYSTVPARPLHLIFAEDWNRRGVLRQTLVWVKNTMVLGHGEYHYQHEPILFGWINGKRHKNSDRTRTSVWYCNKPNCSIEHPTMKPVELWTRAIIDGSRAYELVYDPFLGSGTTMVAAQNLNRKCYGIEIDPNYCAVILQRMSDTFSGINIAHAPQNPL
jgi:DNA modification methylase